MWKRTRIDYCETFASIFSAYTTCSAYRKSFCEQTDKLGIKYIVLQIVFTRNSYLSDKNLVKHYCTTNNANNH